tara:strand:+ start:1407 stop:1967 length:561 start_codon:yes stop_codon:yes gene_type:complete
MRSKVVLFVCGAPGVGKTTVLRGLLDPWSTSLVEKPKWTISGEYGLVGHYTNGLHDGGDTLAYNGAAEAMDYMEGTLFKRDGLRYFILDGDRFTARSAMARVERMPEALMGCVHLTASEETLLARRSQRNTTQNPTWMKGRKTKASRFAAMFHTMCLHIETDGLEASQITRMIHDKCVNDLQAHIA